MPSDKLDVYPDAIPSTPAPLEPMRLRLVPFLPAPSPRSAIVPAVVLILGVHAVPTVAQPVPIQAGQTISGALQPGDGELVDDSYFDLYEYRGQPGEALVVTLRSSDFDAYLQGGPADGADMDVADEDDDGAGGTDARMTVTVGATGVYRIRANSYGGGQTGSYTLTVTSDRPAAASSGATPITAGQTVTGSLDTSDSRLTDDSYFDLYAYRGQAGETVVVTLRSSDFDAFLQGGPSSGGSIDVEESDDDGAGGTDSRITATIGPSGTYLIRANSLGAGETGRYTLSLESSASSSAGGGNSLRAGQTVSGRLDSSDAQLVDDSYFDSYTYSGNAGDRLLVTMTSSDFDTFLSWGRGSGNDFSADLTDDDGAGNTNSRIEVTLDRSGEYVIRANSYGGGETGAYTLSIENLAASTSGFPTISLGQTVNSRLDGSDPVRSDDTPYELYVYRGQPGEQLLVTMRSADFDTYLQAGRLIGDRFEADVSDDDSGGGTDSQVLATVDASGSLAILANIYSAGGSGAFSLSVESLSGASGSAAETAAAEAGIPTIGPGGSATGSLTSSDPILADSSYFDSYVYAGNPGDRIRITLTSSDFDAYLGWGRMEDTRFSGDVYDDDSAGGTNAQLEVTVDGTGVFAMIANTYTSGQSGDYTISVERLEAASVPAAPTSGESGKWLYRYEEAITSAHRSLSQRVKQAAALEEITAALQQRYTLPRPVQISFDSCDMINAFYSPRDTQITFCYELLEFLAGIFVPDGAWTEEQRANVFGAVQFIMMHEVGHALVDVLDLPITGREEDVADQLAVYVMVRDSEKGAQGAYAGVSALQPSSNQFDETQLADEHSLGPVRLYNVMCWIYGSDPTKYSNIVTSGSLPQDRAVRCPGEWDRMSKAWQRLLASYRP